MSSLGARPRILALVGATGVGKTRLVLALAERVPLEVISADSRTVYRGMDIATAKPTPEERARTRHHLIDVVDPDEPYTLATYQAQALAAIEETRRRGRLPVLVGGAGLYVSAVCDGLVLPEVPPDTAYRQELEDLARRRGWQALQPLLEAVDPVSAGRIDARNVRRVIRALEVHRATGKPFSVWQKPDTPPVEAVRIGLSLERRRLWEQIDARIDTWLAGGLIQEVRGLLERGFSPELPSMSGLGYREIAAHLRGEISLDEARQRMQTATHQYAKRQMIWFRRDPRITWFEADRITLDDDVIGLFG